MKKLVVFDLDGTLVDSIHDLGASVNYALGRHGLPLHPISDYYDFIGNGMEMLVRRSMNEKHNDDRLYAEIRKDFDLYYSRHCNDRTVAYSNVADLLFKLDKKGVKAAVLTNKAHEYVGDILKKCFPGYSFCAYMGQQLGIHRKPHPQGFSILLNKLSVSTEDVLYVGDSDVDVKTAENMGVDMVAVTYGYKSDKELIKAGARVLVNTPEEILSYV